MVAAAAETPEPESGTGTGSGLGWQRGGCGEDAGGGSARSQGAPLPVLSAGGTFTRLSITSQMSDAAATRAGDKEHCLQWRHGAMTTSRH